MSFKSDQQRKAVMAMLSLKRKKPPQGTHLRLYHTSGRPLKKFNQHKPLSLHAGTTMAAFERATNVGACGCPNSSYMHEIVLENPRVLKSNARRVPRYEPRGMPTDLTEYIKRHGSKALGFVGDGGRILSEFVPSDSKRLGKLSAADIKGIRLRRRLAEKYDVIPYVNAVEHKGSVSYIILNPRKVKVKGIKKIKDRAASFGLPMFWTKKTKFEK